MATDVRTVDQTDMGVYWNDYSHTDELIETMISLVEQFAPGECSSLVREYEKHRGTVYDDPADWSLRSRDNEAFSNAENALIEIESELIDSLENALNDCLIRSDVPSNTFWGMLSDGGCWGLFTIDPDSGA
jgi:hypothetical protein